MWAKLFGFITKYAPLALQFYLEKKANKPSEEK